jgi:predicted anti-sigma-YlaC factor YlaD
MRIFRIFRRRRPQGLACIEFVEFVTDYVEGVMSEDDARRVEAHLAECDGCEEYLEQVLTTITLSGRLTVTDVETMRPDARESLMAAFRQAYSP